MIIINLIFEITNLLISFLLFQNIPLISFLFFFIYIISYKHFIFLSPFIFLRYPDSHILQTIYQKSTTWQRFIHARGSTADFPYLQAQGITHVDDTLTSRYPAVRIRISRDSLKATLMPGSLFTGRPFFPKI